MCSFSHECVHRGACACACKNAYLCACSCVWACAWPCACTFARALHNMWPAPLHVTLGY